MNPFILILLILVTVSTAFGAVEVEEVTFGFGDGYKVGTWAPVNITVRSQDESAMFSAELAVEVRNFSLDTPIACYATPLSGGQRKNFYVYCPKNATQLVIQLVPTIASGDTVLRSTSPNVIKKIPLPTPFARKDYFVLVLAPSGDKLKRLIDKKQLAGSEGAQVHVRYIPSSTLLPRDWIGYSAVDVLVIRESVLTARRISTERQTAMLDWVQRGGTLIISGGSNFHYLKGSFIEPFLPVELKGIETVEMSPDALRQLFDVNDGDAAAVPTGRRGRVQSSFERIQFVPKARCETLLGTAEQIYVAKRNFGDGQILCLAFDYNALPFGISTRNSQKREQQIGETFWHGLLRGHGKSPRQLADRYALALQHEEKIHKQFLEKMPTQVPLIKRLAIALPVYLLSFGCFLFYFVRQRPRSYWIGGCLFVLISVSAIAMARHVLPNNITADRLSILSVYPERQRVHLQSYVSLRTTGRGETSIDFAEGTFIRHQTEKIETLLQGSRVQLRELFVEPWHPTTYVKEAFLPLDAEQLPRTLENTWRVTGREMTYLGNIPLAAELDTELSTASLLLPSNGWSPRLRVTPKRFPPDEELSGAREKFAQILKQEGVLRYLAAETSPYLIGWMSQGLTDIAVDGNVNIYDETLVIFR